MNCFAVPEVEQMHSSGAVDPIRPPITVEQALRLSRGFSPEQRLKAVEIWQPILVRLVMGSWLLLLWQWRRVRLGRGEELAALRASANPRKRKYAPNKLLYTLMLVVLSFALLTGLAMYKPATLWWLSGWFGSWQQLRVLHFATIPAMALLMLCHVLLSLKLGGLRLLRAISW